MTILAGKGAPGPGPADGPPPSRPGVERTNGGIAAVPPRDRGSRGRAARARPGRAGVRTPG